MNFIERRKLFNKPINLKGLNFDFIDYVTLLTNYGEDFKYLADLGKINSGFFFNDKNSFLTLFSESKPFTVMYLEDNEIKYSQNIEIGHSSDLLIDSYYNKNIETNLIYKVYTEPFLTFKDGQVQRFYEDQYDSYLDHPKFIKKMNFDEYYDDFDDFNFNEEGFYVNFERAYQKITYLIDENKFMDLIHDSDGLFQLRLRNHLGLKLKNNYNVITHPELSIVSNLNFNDIKSITEIINDDNCREVIDLFTSIFKNDDSIITSYNSSLNKGYIKKIKFKDAINKMNL